MTRLTAIWSGMDTKLARETGWRADGPDVRRMLTIMALACAIEPLSFLVKLAITHEALWPDFFGLWSFGRFVLTHPPAAIYDDQAVFAFQTGFGMPAASGYPFPYPPWILLVLAPFGALPYAVARVAWLVLTFGAYAAALATWRWERRLLALLVLAPTSAICFLVGQNGFLSAALMLAGIRMLATRPLVAGALLAAVAYKPNLAILIPFALLFGLHWRAVAGAALAVLVLTVTTALAFGADIWIAWFGYMRDRAVALSAGRDALLDMMPTVTSGVLLLGGGMFIAHVAQAAAAAGGVLAIWRVRGRSDVAARAVLPLATVLATPYLFHYDLPMVTGAVLAVIAARIAERGRFGAAEFAVLLGCILAPLVQVAHFAGVAILTPAVIGAAVWLIARGAGAKCAALPARARLACD